MYAPPHKFYTTQWEWGGTQYIVPIGKVYNLYKRAGQKEGAESFT